MPKTARTKKSNRSRTATPKALRADRVQETASPLPPSMRQWEKTPGANKPAGTNTAAREKRIEDIEKSALDMMKGNLGAANHWLNRRTGMLDGETPVQYAARSKKCAKEVEAIISRVRHGVFS